MAGAWWLSVRGLGVGQGREAGHGHNTAGNFWKTSKRDSCSSVVASFPGMQEGLSSISRTGGREWEKEEIKKVQNKAFLSKN